MKILLVALNAKYIHSSLALPSLQAFLAPRYPIDTMEFTINQSEEKILIKLTEQPYDLIAFSVYIWNVEKIMNICRKLKIIHPGVKLLLGGPEVSFDPHELLVIEDVDFVVCGEGEEAFFNLLEALSQNRPLTSIKGLVCKENGKINGSESLQIVSDLRKIPAAYDIPEKLPDDKIIYLETSRGCPFRCDFCLSSKTSGVRYFPLELVKKQIDQMVARHVKLVKFVDRTFNADEQRAIQLFQHIMAIDKSQTTFHMEMNGILLSDSMMDVLSQARPGLFQFEIGIQSTNQKTCQAVQRVGDFKKVKERIFKLKKQNNIHLHLDLIAGLPYEDYHSFGRSFEDVYALHPDKLQLGFLKVLKGSGIWENSNKYGIVYDPNPPYEVLKTNWLSYEDIRQLKSIEDVVEKFYNEGYFKRTLQYLLSITHIKAWAFFEKLATYWLAEGEFYSNHSRDALYIFFYQYLGRLGFSGKRLDELRTLLRFDYDLQDKNFGKSNPFHDQRRALANDRKHQLLKNKDFLDKKLPSASRLPLVELLKQTKIESYPYNGMPIYLGSGFDLAKKETFVLFYLDKENGRVQAVDITQDMVI